MNESGAKKAFRTACTRAMEGIFIIKHNDRSFIGLPDASYNWYGRTVWIEMKYLAAGRNVLGELRPGQLPTLVKLERQSMALVLAYSTRDTVVWSPKTLLVAGIKERLPKPAEAADSDEVALEQFLSEGAIMFPGHAHDRAAQLVRRMIFSAEA